MGRFSLAALMIWALCFSGTDCGSAKVQSPQTRETKTDESPAATAVILTHEQPEASLPVEEDVFTKRSEILEVTLTKVVNPANTPVSIFVYLSVTEVGKSEPERIELGKFSLYPADRPARFLLGVDSALRSVSASGTPTTKAPAVRLAFEMKRIDDTKAWTPVELTIAQPKWRAAEE